MVQWWRICLPGQETKATGVWSLGWEDSWRRKWQPTLVFLPGKSHGQMSLVGYNPWGCKESDMTSWLKNNSLRTFLCYIIGLAIVLLTNFVFVSVSYGFNDDLEGFVGEMNPEGLFEVRLENCISGFLSPKWKNKNKRISWKIFNFFHYPELNIWKIFGIMRESIPSTYEQFGLMMIMQSFAWFIACASAF